jgi:hypothetical protein
VEEKNSWWSGREEVLVEWKRRSPGGVEEKRFWWSGGLGCHVTQYRVMLAVVGRRRHM